MYSTDVGDPLDCYPMTQLQINERQRYKTKPAWWQAQKSFAGSNKSVLVGTTVLEPHEALRTSDPILGRVVGTTSPKSDCCVHRDTRKGWCTFRNMT